MKLTVTYQITGERSPESTIDTEEVLREALPMSVSAINTFLQSEGHTLELRIDKIELEQ